MKRKKITMVLLTLCISLLLIACNDGTADPDPTAAANTATQSPQIVVTDMDGREVKLDAPAEKIVALTAADCEILFEIGAGDALVGRGEYCDYPAEVSKISTVSSGDDTNIEQIIALSPELVIMSTMAQTDEQVLALENAGIKVIVTAAKDIEGVYTAIELMGKVTGKDTEAATVIKDMKTTFEEISGKVTGDGSQTVYFEVSPLEYGLWTSGKGTFMDELASMLGLKNAFSDVEGWAEVSQEQVIERSPDFIVTIGMSYGDGPTPVEEILSREGWQNITAIKNQAVCSTDSDEITRPGPRLADAVETLYSFVYEDTAAATDAPATDVPAT